MSQLSNKIPHSARVIERVQETPDIFTLSFEFSEPEAHKQYSFEPGQFNMLYLPAVGEIPISISSSLNEFRSSNTFKHTIRNVGRVTAGFAALKVGDSIGVRGPFGTHWPMEKAKNKSLFVLTGGLGCAPAVSAINHVLRHRQDYGHLTIMQGVRHTNDLIWQEQYDAWSKLDDVDVYLAATIHDKNWHGKEGHITELFKGLEVDPQAMAFSCGPEPMMIACANVLLERGLSPDDIFLSLERNMQCGTGHCGHCQLGAKFICGDGPIFSWSKINPLLKVKNL